MKFGAETPGLHGGILFHQLSGFIDRRHLEDVEATQIAVVIKWSCGYELSFAVRPFDELKVAGERLFIFRVRSPVQAGPFRSRQNWNVRIWSGASGCSFFH